MSYAFLRQIEELNQRVIAAEARIAALEAAKPSQAPYEAEPAKRPGGWPRGRPRKLPGNGMVARSG